MNKHLTWIWPPGTSHPELLPGAASFPETPEILRGAQVPKRAMTSEHLTLGSEARLDLNRQV